MRICIVGLGNVGMAYAKVLRHTINDKGLDVVLHGLDTDKAKVGTMRLTHNHILDHVTTEPKTLPSMNYILICTDMPMESTLVESNKIIDIIHDIPTEENSVIVIKSTMGIGSTRALSRLVDRDVFYIPETLREGIYAENDITHNKFYIGVKDKNNPQLEKIIPFLDVVKNVYEGLTITDYQGYKCGCSFEVGTYTEIELLKLTRNAYIANKITFNNVVNEIARNHNIDTSLTKNMLLNDPYLNTERYNDVSFGFGGYCLPKDTNHLSEMIDGRENPINIFKSLININRSLIDMHARMVASVYCNHKKTFPEARIVFFKLGFKKDHESIDNSRMFHVMNTIHDYPIDTNICYIHDYDLGISNERITLKDIKENDIIVSEFMYKELEGLSNMIYTAEKIYIGGKENV